MSGIEHRILGGHAFHRVPVLIRGRVETVPAGAQLYKHSQIDVFRDATVATFTMVATIQSGAEAITKRDRGALALVQHESSWKIVYEHFSAAE